MHSNCCFSFLFEPEIQKIRLSLHKIYNNIIVNFQEFMVILIDNTRKSDNLYKTHRLCVCVCVYIYIHTYFIVIFSL